MSNSIVGQGLRANFTLINVSIRSWQGRALDKTASTDVNRANHAIVNSAKVYKNLLSGADAELKAAKAAHSAVRSLVYTLPPFQGWYLMPNMDAFEFMTELNARVQEANASVVELQSVAATRIAAAKANLGALANDGDYPDPDAIADLFSITIDYGMVPESSDFSQTTLPPQMAAFFEQNSAMKQADAVKDALTAVRTDMVKELSRIFVQMGKSARGEKTRMHDTLISNIKRMANNLNALNLEKDPDVDDLLERIHQSITRYTVEQVKNSPTLAMKMEQSAQSLTTAVEGLELW